MPWYPSDWLGSETHAELSAEERAVYFDLLNRAWMRGGTLPNSDEQLRKLGGVSHDFDVSRVKARFQLDAQGTLYHPRLLEEYEKVAKRSESASKSASIRWDKKHDANALRTHCESNARAFGSGSGSSSLDSEGGCKGETITFADFWALYPLRKSKNDAMKAWAKLKPEHHSEVLDGVRREIAWRARRTPSDGVFVPEWKLPATWLNKAAWLDELPEPKSKQSPVVDPVAEMKRLEREQAQRATDAKTRKENQSPEAVNAILAELSNAKGVVRGVR